MRYPFNDGRTFQISIMNLIIFDDICFAVFSIYVTFARNINQKRKYLLNNEV
ncbi:hypothetical protein HMPREF9148_02264 [Prevotella sp. F0091]|nr:hypothetical protein HMPREF9148_02264 [Prevotella sp. F0091]